MSVRDMNHDPLTEYPHLLHTLAYHSAAKLSKSSCGHEASGFTNTPLRTSTSSPMHTLRLTANCSWWKRY